MHRGMPTNACKSRYEHVRVRLASPTPSSSPRMPLGQKKTRKSCASPPPLCRILKLASHPPLPPGAAHVDSKGQRVCEFDPISHALTIYMDAVNLFFYILRVGTVDSGDVPALTSMHAKTRRFQTLVSIHDSPCALTETESVPFSVAYTLMLRPMAYCRRHMQRGSAASVTAARSETPLVLCTCFAIF